MKMSLMSTWIISVYCMKRNKQIRPPNIQKLNKARSAGKENLKKRWIINSSKTTTTTKREKHCYGKREESIPSTEIVQKQMHLMNRELTDGQNRKSRVNKV